MKRPSAPTGSIFKINFDLLLAFIFMMIAWAIWPSNPKWWGFGLLSILMGLSAIGAFLDAVRTMAKLKARDKVLAEQMAYAKELKEANLASEQALKDAGMIDE